MSEETEKIIHIVMPDLLNYLKMVESGEIIKKRIERNNLIELEQEKKEVKNLSQNKKG